MSFSKRRLRRFIRVSVKEALLRFFVLIFSTVILSMGMKFVNGSSVNTGYGSYLMIQLGFFAAFQAINIFSCKRSSLRVHRYYSRYYTSNIAAYLIYILVSVLFLVVFGPVRYISFFGVTVTLAFNQMISIAAMYKSIAIFYLVTVLLIAVSPYKGVPGIISHFKKKNHDESDCIIASKQS